MSTNEKQKRSKQNVKLAATNFKVQNCRGGGGVNCLVPASTENLVTNTSTEQFATLQKKILLKLISLAMYYTKWFFHLTVSMSQLSVTPTTKTEQLSWLWKKKKVHRKKHVHVVNICFFSLKCMLSKAHITSNNKLFPTKKVRLVNTGESIISAQYNFVHIAVFLCGLHLYDKLFNNLIIKDDSSK